MIQDGHRILVVDDNAELLADRLRRAGRAVAAAVAELVPSRDP